MQTHTRHSASRMGLPGPSQGLDAMLLFLCVEQHKAEHTCQVPLTRLIVRSGTATGPWDKPHQWQTRDTLPPLLCEILSTVTSVNSLTSVQGLI